MKHKSGYVEPGDGPRRVGFLGAVIPTQRYVDMVRAAMEGTRRQPSVGAVPERQWHLVRQKGLSRIELRPQSVLPSLDDSEERIEGPDGVRYPSALVADVQLWAPQGEGIDTVGGSLEIDTFCGNAIVRASRVRRVLGVLTRESYVRLTVIRPVAEPHRDDFGGPSAPDMV